MTILKMIEWLNGEQDALYIIRCDDVRLKSQQLFSHQFSRQVHIYLKQYYCLTAECTVMVMCCSRTLYRMRSEHDWSCTVNGHDQI